MSEEICHLISDNGSLLTAHIGGGYDPTIHDSTIIARAQGGGPTFRTVTEAPDDWLLRAGVGADVVITDRLDLQLVYSYEYRDDFDNQLLSATVRWSF